MDLNQWRNAMFQIENFLYQVDYFEIFLLYNRAVTRAFWRPV